MHTKKTKKNYLPGIIILILGLAIIIGILAYSYYSAATYDSPFFPERRTMGQRLYAETLARDLQIAYPQTPEELMALHSAASFLLYGDFTDDADFLVDVINWQRQMYSPELLAANPPDTQLENLLDAIAFLYETGITPRRPEIISVRFYYLDQAAVHMRQVMVHYDNLYWVYFLETNEDDRWKIMGWVRTDYTFSHEIP